MSSRALSDRLAQGWELVTYTAAGPYGDNVHHCFLIRRGNVHKVLTIRKNMFGKGYSASEMDV